MRRRDDVLAADLLVDRGEDALRASLGKKPAAAKAASAAETEVKERKGAKRAAKAEETVLAPAPAKARAKK